MLLQDLNIYNFLMIITVCLFITIGIIQRHQPLHVYTYQHVTNILSYKHVHFVNMYIFCTLITQFDNKHASSVNIYFQYVTKHALFANIFFPYV